ncbi:hypothetical protein R6V09_14955 [Streptomyces sp. W16]|uniref:hypothetical protein n=1 Tax=Streptomyces sp. W16 TaxID=3076631 RepID=UPI00295C15A3|nr:hypothetical protein [Streptomyces sp. W16]MDV9171416.1 hypothetical protein [Streptomyces sp. W16]
MDNSAPERANADARRMIAFYLTVKTYDPLPSFVASQRRRAAYARASLALIDELPTP